ncbi:MAG: DUF4861 family protein [Bacteroidales bacterium]|jgi:hypothetical protein|nr:DUF4861 family protein [Bacteroidales bacterium]
MTKLVFSGFLLTTILLLTGCSSEETGASLTVINDLDMSRDFETILIEGTQVPEISSDDFTRLWVKERATGKILLSQLIDRNSDGEPDAIAFQPSLDANEVKTFDLFFPSDDDAMPDIENSTFSRFVPERMTSLLML